MPHHLGHNHIRLCGCAPQSYLAISDLTDLQYHYSGFEMGMRVVQFTEIRKAHMVVFCQN